MIILCLAAPSAVKRKLKPLARLTTPRQAAREPIAKRGHGMNGANKHMVEAGKCEFSESSKKVKKLYKDFRFASGALKSALVEEKNKNENNLSISYAL